MWLNLLYVWGTFSLAACPLPVVGVGSWRECQKVRITVFTFQSQMSPGACNSHWRVGGEAISPTLGSSTRAFLFRLFCHLRGVRTAGRLLLTPGLPRLSVRPSSLWPSPRAPGLQGRTSILGGLQGLSLVASRMHLCLCAMGGLGFSVAGNKVLMGYRSSPE